MKPTFLTEEQIWGSKNLDVIDKYGAIAGASDLAVILGALMFKGKNNRGITPTVWWSASARLDGDVRVGSRVGESHDNPLRRYPAGRLALPPSMTSGIRNTVAKTAQNSGGWQTIEYGEYPQTVLNDADATQMAKRLQNGQLKTTGRYYTFDTVRLNGFHVAPQFTHHYELEYMEQRYICATAKANDSDSILSDGRLVVYNKPYWVRVEPIVWLVDPSGWWVARDCLFAGIRFDGDPRYDGNFDKTEIAGYLENYFANQIMPKQR